jgi:hypothetical protein
VNELEPEEGDKRPELMPVLTSDFLGISLSLVTTYLAPAIIVGIGGGHCGKAQPLHKLGSQLGQLGCHYVQVSSSSILFVGKGFSI